MPLELTGSFGRFALVGGDLRVMELNLEPARQFFREVAIKKTDIAANEMGIYSFLPVGRWGKAKMNTLSVPKHLLQTRTNCKTWTPKGKAFLQQDEIDTAPVEYMGEQCTDGLIGDCLEYVLGTGNDVRDITATPEGRQLFAQVINNIYLGLGNSFYDLVTFGQNSLITDSDTSGWWNTTNETNDTLADFKDQQLGIPVKGHITLVEEVKAAGDAHFNVDIPSGDVSGAKYTGSDVTALFDSCIEAAPSKFKIVLNRERGTFPAAFLVSRGIFNAYKNYIISQYSAIPEGYRMMINGEAVRGVLLYDNLPVVAMDEWSEFDELVGVNSHRVLLTAMGNLAVAHDVPAINQYGGIGLRVEQSMRLKDKGITYMYTNFRVGTAIADTTFMVNASRILTP